MIFFKKSIRESEFVKKDGIGSRKEKAVETKNKIYESAEQLFTKYGFDDVSVAAIVEMAGVSKGSFYVHFDSKDSLIASLISDYIDQLDLNYKLYIESFPMSAKASDILYALVEKIVDTMTDTIGYDIIKIIYGVQISRTIDTDTISSYNRDVYKIFNLVIGKGVEQGEFKPDLTIDIITKHCVLALRGLAYEWCIRYPEFDFKAQAIQHFGILLSGLKS